MDDPMINDQKQTILVVTDENLFAISLIILERIQNEIMLRKWVKPEVAMEMLNVKRPTIMKLWAEGEIDLTWIGDDFSKKWLADRQSIEEYLERKRNFNGPGSRPQRGRKPVVYNTRKYKPQKTKTR